MCAVVAIGCRGLAEPARAETANPVVLYRINCGGPPLLAEDSPLPGWTGDTSLAPAPYSNYVATGVVEREIGGQPNDSVPLHVPELLFKTERYGPMQWNLPAPAGAQVQVRLFFAETYSGAMGFGQRVFHVVIEGVTVLSNYDIYADVGGYTGVMKTFDVTVGGDGNIDIDFIGVVENPLLNGLEIVTTCVSAVPIWQNSGFSPQDARFTAQFSATPGVTNLDGLVGLAANPGTSFADFAVLVRFNTAGQIDARDGNTYRAETVIAYAPNQAYEFRLVVDVPSHTYSAYVKPPGGVEQTLALNYAFRTEQSNVSSLGYCGVYSEPAALQVCSLVVNPWVRNVTRNTWHPTIQAAIDAAQNGDQLMLSRGIYTGDGNRDIDGKGKSFSIRGPNPSEPAVVAATVIDCQGSPNDRHRAFNLQYAGQANVVVEGLTITGGYAPWDYNDSSAGGAILCTSADLHIDHCVFHDNVAGVSSFTVSRNADGGAVYYAGNSVNIANSSFVGNRAVPERPFGDSRGGAICMIVTEHVSLTNCRIIDNLADTGRLLGTSRGGGLYTAGATIIQDCDISENTALSSNDPGHGGGVYCDGSLDLTDSRIADNLAQGGNSINALGGGVVCFGPATVEGCRFLYNSAGGVGGGLSCWGPDSVVRNCTFAFNASGNMENPSGPGGGGVYGAQLVENCRLVGNISSQGGGLDGCAIVRGSLIAANAADYRGGGTADCPEVSHCRLIGNAGPQHGVEAAHAIYASDTIFNCLVAGNGTGQGAAIMEAGSVSNSTIVANRLVSDWGATGIDTLFVPGSARNCIVWGNGPEGQLQVSMLDPPTYSCIQYWIGGGTGNFAEDPLLPEVDTGTWTAGAAFDFESGQSTLIDAGKNWPANSLAGKLINPDVTQDLQFYIVSNSADTIVVWGDVDEIVQGGDGYRIVDYHLPATSPCVDAGDPDGYEDEELDLDDEPRVQGCHVDLGADESPYARGASADFDGDCHVMQADLDHFTACALGPGMPQSDPACLDANLDADALGAVDTVDFAILQRCWTGSSLIAHPSCQR